MIEHTVSFALKSELSPERIDAFFSAVDELSTIPGVRDMQVHRQISEKNPYQYRISMKFFSQEDYDGYNSHEFHVQFLEKHWFTEVAGFQEADFVAMPK